jgi:Mce-associated membrane protein
VSQHLDELPALDLTSPVGEGPEPVVADGSEPVVADAQGSSTAATDEAGARRGGPWIGDHLARLVAGLVIVALAAGLVLTVTKLRHRDALDQAGRSALQVARSDAVAIASYDHRTLDHDFGVVEAASDPSFKASWQQTSGPLKRVLLKYQATAVSKVLAAGLVSADTHRAVALVFLNQVATNTTQKNGPITDQSRVEITLVRRGGRWLIDKVQLL